MLFRLQGYQPMAELLVKLGARKDIMNKEEKYPKDYCETPALRQLCSLPLNEG